jgi:hypothetical protein
MPCSTPGARPRRTEALDAGLAALGRRSGRLAPVVAALHALEREGKLGAPLKEQASSYVHMYMNRLFRAAALAQELVIYDLLERLYESRMARAKRQR